MSNINIYTSEFNPNNVYLGEVKVNGSGSPDPVRVTGENVSEFTLRDIQISVEGDGAEHVELANDVNGDQGTFASIPIALEDNVAAGEKFYFWMRVGEVNETSPSHKSFQILTSSTSIA